MPGKPWFAWLLALTAACLALGACSMLPQESMAGTLAAESQVVLTIPNPQPFSGREGDPRPDWLGWGASAFAIAPDHSVWIADTAVSPSRVLHFSPSGKLLDTIPLDEEFSGLYDLLATADGIWLLALNSQSPRVVKFDSTGQKVMEAAIPESLMMQNGSVVSNGIFNLWAGQDGSLITSGVNGLHQLLDPKGQVVARPLETLTYGGHTYRMMANDAEGWIDVTVDDTIIEFPPPFYLDSESILGFNPDGSFAVAASVYDPANIAGIIEQFVYYYASDGDLLGVSQLQPNEIPQDFHHSLAFGADGQVYQLISNPDHSVEVVRLGFSQQPPTAVPATATPAVTPMAPLKPTWTVIPANASGADQARETLLAYFTLLSERNYDQGGRLFGGSYEDLPPGPPGDDLGAYWETLCQSTLCLPVARIAEIQPAGEDKFLFFVEFMQPDGMIFQMGACCGGNPASTPNTWQFAYPVEKIAGQWKVLRTPLYIP